MPLKIAVIGTGHLGKIHTKLWKEVSDVELIGVFDSNFDEANTVADDNGTKAFIDISTAIQEADAVSIVTPTVSHFEIAQLAIESGKHVFIEKPITTSIEEAKELIAL